MSRQFQGHLRRPASRPTSQEIVDAIRKSAWADENEARQSVDEPLIDMKEFLRLNQEAPDELIVREPSAGSRQLIAALNTTLGIEAEEQEAADAREVGGVGAAFRRAGISPDAVTIHDPDKADAVAELVQGIYDSPDPARAAERLAPLIRTVADPDAAWAETRINPSDDGPTRRAKQDFEAATFEAWGERQRDVAFEKRHGYQNTDAPDGSKRILKDVPAGELQGMLARLLDPPVKPPAADLTHEQIDAMTPDQLDRWLIENPHR